MVNRISDLLIKNKLTTTSTVIASILLIISMVTNVSVVSATTVPTIDTFTINGLSSGIYVKQGAQLTIQWSASNASTCFSVFGAGTGWDSTAPSALTRPVSGTYTTIMGSSTSQSFRLVCSNGPLTPANYKDVMVNIGTAPVVPIANPVVVPDPLNSIYTNPFANSSSYLFTPSSKDNLLPYSGFGVNTVIDSCSSYPKAIADVAKINQLLMSQATKQVGDYFTASCNSVTSADCDSRADTINNLFLTYATYKIESYKLAKNQSLTCNTTTNQPIAGASTYDWYNIDFASMAYASVRSIYATPMDYTGNIGLAKRLDNAINTNFTSAIANNKFVDTATTVTLRAYAEKAFNVKTTSAGSTAMVGSTLQAQTLLVASPFLFFGLTDNLTDKTIGALAFNSLKDYYSYYTAKPTRFGGLYSAENAPLIDAGNIILNTTLQKSIDDRLNSDMSSLKPLTASIGTESPFAQSDIIQSTQKASVISAVGGWFKGLWNGIYSFFSGLFGVERAGAATNVSSGPGASGPGASVLYPECPAYKNPKILPSLKITAGVYDKVFTGRTVEFDNFFDRVQETSKIAYDTTYIPLTKRTLTDSQKRFLKQWDTYMADNYKQKSSKFSAGGESEFNYMLLNGNDKTYGDTNPYNCYKSFPVDDYSSRLLGYKTATVSVNASDGQSAKFLSPIEDSLLNFWIAKLQEKYNADDSKKALVELSSANKK